MNSAVGCSRYQVLVLISALPLALPEPRAQPELEGSSPLQTGCLRCSLHCLPGVLGFPSVSVPIQVSWRTSASSSWSLMSSEHLLGEASLHLHQLLDILISLLPPSSLTFSFLSLSLSYSICPIFSSISLILLFFFYNLTRWTFIFLFCPFKIQSLTLSSPRQHFMFLCQLLLNYVHTLPLKTEVTRI